ncbi:MAG: elongation factor G, partial [Bacteroidales bacterium]|nr:elongation factor G [Bacteroidales bacterium]
PVESMKVQVMDGSFHPVDSDALSFEICAKMAYKEACKKASPKLLEPIMKVEVVTPEESMGDVVGDLNKRRGQIRGMDTRNNASVVKAFVPLAEMFGYVTDLRTITSGRATSTMEFDHFEQVPANIAETIINQQK